MIILDAYWQSRGDARDDGHMLAKAADTGPGHSMEVVSSLAVLALAVGVLVRLVWRRPDFAGAPLATGFFIGLAVALAVALLVPRWFSAPTADSTEVAKLFDVQRKDIAEIRHDVAGLDSKLGALQAEGEGLNRKVRQIDDSLKTIASNVTDTDKLIKQHVSPPPPPPPPPPPIKPLAEQTALDGASVAAGNTVYPAFPPGKLLMLQSANIKFCLLQGDTGDCQAAPDTKGCPHNFYDLACQPVGGKLAHVDPKFAKPHGRYCVVIAYTLKDGGRGVAWGGPVEPDAKRPWSRAGGESSLCESIANKQATAPP